MLEAVCGYAKTLYAKPDAHSRRELFTLAGIEWGDGPKTDPIRHAGE